ncbi:protein of unknown function [Acetoanaerobium sticklandii]|uniref:Uncharacterized protein n=1 Tax=Acetoanaerobium sticklandii (strain ATCC 12662 / DSM 519 / JCM 1433 / CCUG 9281 / NCIMB 10654 / HF) TaxID=499177 RepID=E3PVR6_ACESD|nr:hypothetical protein [Acetoanaerobium sticklandii]CBH22619.1 protein of unknown function [Acetoanaerobium sticklandii]
MENFGTVLAVIGTVGFIVAIWMLFGYLYFKKGNPKKGFLVLFLSLLLVAGGVFIGVQGARKNADAGVALSDEVIKIIETKSVEEATPEQQSQVGMSVYLKISQEDWEKYEDEILSYYISWQKSLNPQANVETLKTEFKNFREKSLSN